MPLRSETRLGPYEILSAIGAGGMGEVYRARDARLGREVALKVLPESVSKDEDRLRRFAQEARAVAALNHPNILAVHDIGSQAGTHYIVTELLEGSTLREKLSSGAVPPRRAIDYAIQIAQGLASTHEKGVVHRDLKPENLFITKDGRIKILDFGLAKQTLAAAAQAGDETTIASGVQTSAGAVLGTAGYMSPEQVRGEAVDQRTDIFALGTVLYEMLSGQRAFHRDSAVETMTAILKEDPPEITSGKTQVSPALERIVRRCLEKDAGQRFQSAKDLGFALDSISAGTTASETQAVVGRKRGWQSWRVAMLVVAIAVVGVVAVVLRGLSPNAQHPRYDRLTFRRGSISAARFAPDGQNVIYSAAWDDPKGKLYRSRVDGSDLRALDIPASDILAVSRSGDLAVITASTGHLARVPLNGGAPRELLDNVIAADWSPDGMQLAVVRVQNGKSRLEYPIGKPLYESLGMISGMRFSPQGDTIAFMDHPIPGDDRGTVAIVDIKGSKRTLTREWPGEWGLAWSPDGGEIWFTATDSYDWDRPLRAVTRSGKQRLILRIPGALYLEDISFDGRVLFRRQERRFEVAEGQTGGETRLLSWFEIMIAASISHDGNYALIGDWSGSGDYGVYLAKLDGSPPVLLGSGAAGSISPDNKWVTSILPSDTTKVIILPTGIGENKTITAPNFRYRSATWTSDGRRIVIRGSESDRPVRVWIQDIAGGSPRAITPEGVDGLFVTVNHADYVSVHDPTGAVRLYSIDGGEPRAVAGVGESDRVIGGSINSDVLYVSSDSSAISMQVTKVNITTGQRQPFLTISPTDSAGIVGLSRPIFSSDEKRYIYNQVRELSVLYMATGLK
jgi:eukaryotic-like serine/threonine-protein kinase